MTRCETNLQLKFVTSSKFIRKENKIDSFRSHPLSVGEDVTDKITRIHRILGEDVPQPEATSEERVGQVTRLSVEVTNQNDRVSPSRLLHKLKDLKQLAVTATRISLKQGYRQKQRYFKISQTAKTKINVVWRTEFATTL